MFDSGLCYCSIAQRQGMKRGWFTYTDLCVLLEQSAWSQALTAIYQHFTKVRRRFVYLVCFRCFVFFLMYFVFVNNKVKTTEE